MQWNSPQFVLTVLILGGFAAAFVVALFAPLDAGKIDLVKTVMTAMGGACLVSIGYWFKNPSGGA